MNWIKIWLYAAIISFGRLLEYFLPAKNWESIVLTMGLCYGIAVWLQWRITEKEKKR